MGGKKKRASKDYQVRISLNALQNIDEITGYIAFIDQQPLHAIKVGDSIWKLLIVSLRILLHSGNVQRFQLKLKYIAGHCAYLGQLSLELMVLK